MRISVLSGKGGTGKTFVSVNLSKVYKDSLYIDCDVEEPNGHLFLKPDIIKKEDVTVKIPIFNNDLCNGCRECVNFCKFNALAYIKNKIKIFNELCHSCGGCHLLCNQNAISEHDRAIGNIEYGVSGEVEVRTGTLNTGEATGVPIIKRLIDNIPVEKNVIIDCPPGSSCLVMECIKDSDYCLMVVEPTLFGIHNFKMVYKLVKLFNKRHGVIINKAISDMSELFEYFKENDIEVVKTIPYDNNIACINSKGDITIDNNNKYRKMFIDIVESLR